MDYKRLLKDYEDKLAERAKLLREIKTLKGQIAKLTIDVGKLNVERSRLQGELGRFKLSLREAEDLAKLKAQLKTHGISLEDLNAMQRVLMGIKELNYNPKAIVETIAYLGSLARSLEELEKTKKGLMAEIEDLKRMKREILKEFPTPLIEKPDGSIAAVIPQRIVEHKDGSIEIEYLKKPNGTLRTIKLTGLNPFNDKYFKSLLEYKGT